MNWEAIGAVGEVVGAAGVIASLVYLAVQIQQNTRSVRRTSARQSSEKNALALRALADYSDLFSGDHMGLDRIAELNPSERTRFDMIMGMWMQAKEQDFADVREGILEPEYAVPYQGFMRQIFACSGGALWWTEHRGWFSASFQREIDELLKVP